MANLIEKNKDGQVVAVHSVDLDCDEVVLRDIRNSSRQLSAAANRFKSNFELINRQLTLNDCAEFCIDLNRMLSSCLHLLADMNQIENKLIFYKQLTSE